MRELRATIRANLRRGAALAVVAGLVAAAAGGCRSSPEPKPEAPNEAKESEADVAKFRFDWPEGATLQAEVDRELRRAGGRSKSFHAGYTMEGTAVEGEFRVRIEPQLDVGTTGTNRVTTADALAAGSIIAMPTIVAGTNGAFRSVEDVGATRKEYRRAVERLNGGPLSARQSKVLKPVLQRKYLAERARQYWSLLVGTWAGSQMEVGTATTAEASDDFTFPMLGRREVTMELECTLEERIACSERPNDAGTEGCVRIEMQARPDVRKLKDSMQKWVDTFSRRQAKRQGMKKPPDLRVSNVFLRTNMTLVTEPETLVPHQFRQEKTVRLTLKAPSGEERSYRLVDERRTSFSAK